MLQASGVCIFNAIAVLTCAAQLGAWQQLPIVLQARAPCNDQGMQMEGTSVSALPVACVPPAHPASCMQLHTAHDQLTIALSLLFHSPPQVLLSQVHCLAMQQAVCTS